MLSKCPLIVLGIYLDAVKENHKIATNAKEMMRTTRAIILWRKIFGDVTLTKVLYELESLTTLTEGCKNGVFNWKRAF